MKLYYFGAGEFHRGGRDWFPDMEPRLLVLLDVFRHQWGAAVAISPASGSLGRLLGDRVSDHNFELHGAVLAADVMPKGLFDRASASRAIELATRCGFTAIGLYPDWHPAPGLHLGARPSRKPGDPALWGALQLGGGQKYVSLERAMEVLQ